MFSPELTHWLCHGERGISSETIVEVMEGLPRGTLAGRWISSAPFDPSDLRRCMLLLRAVPGYRQRITELVGVSLYWAVLVGAWGELEALMQAELGDDLTKGSAPRTFARMLELFSIARGDHGR